jgi:hypothetical protein
MNGLYARPLSYLASSTAASVTLYNPQYTGSLVAGDSYTAIDSIDLGEVAPTLLGRPASILRDANLNEAGARMNALDQIFGWLMIAFGVAQSVTNFRIQSSSHLSLSLSGTAAAMIVSGFLNVSRARHSDGLTRAFSVIGNLLIMVLAVGIAWPVRYHLLHNWQALGILVVTAIELLFALRG